MIVLDDDSVQRDIMKYQLDKAYQKACIYIEQGLHTSVNLKLRKPKSAGVWQFRITKKFCALAIR